jgi:putative flippase GtrA
MNKLFTNFKKIFFYFYNQEIFRFLLAGGINTLVGGIILPYIISQFISSSGVFDIPLVLGYLLWFPFAYLLQVYLVFRTVFDWKRFWIYPTTQIPNYAINTSLLYIFKDLLQMHELIAYILAALIATPIMFLLVKLVVKKK